MMKKIVWKLEGDDQKKRTKAMHIVITFPGVESVSWERENKNLIVIGDGDPIKIVRALKKLCPTEILTIGPAKDPMKKNEDEIKKEEGKPDYSTPYEMWKKTDDKKHQENIPALGIPYISSSPNVFSPAYTRVLDKSTEPLIGFYKTTDHKNPTKLLESTSQPSPLENSNLVQIPTLTELLTKMSEPESTGNLQPGLNDQESLRKLLVTKMSDWESTRKLPSGLNDQESPRKFHVPDVSINVVSTARKDIKEVQLDFPGSDYTLFDIKEFLGLMENVLEYKLPKSKSMAVRNLKVMHIRNINLSDIPDNLSFPDLENLFLQSKIDSVSISSSIFERVPALRVLDMSNTSIKMLPPSFSKLIKLELLLHGCHFLTELPHDIGAIVNLNFLDLSGCTKSTDRKDIGEIQLDFHDSHGTVFDITELLGLMGEILEYNLFSWKLVGVMNLKVIHMRNSILPVNPYYLSFPNLEMLFLQSNLDLSNIPSSFFERMPALKVLDMSNTSIETLPPWVYNLTKLEELILQRCELLIELTHEIGALRNLRLFDLSGCTNLSKIPDLIDIAQSLSSLDLTNCKTLTKLPESICKLRSLQNLNLSGCTNLVEIAESIELLEGLSSLDLTDCKSLTKLPESMCNMRSLKCLYLSGCSRLFEVPAGWNDPESPKKFHAPEVSINTLSTARKADTMEVN